MVHLPLRVLIILSVLLIAPGGHATFQVRASVGGPETGDPDAVVIIVSAENPVQELSRDQVDAIFMGRSLLFPDGRRAVPVEQALGSEARSRFLSRILERSEAQVKAHWSRLVFTGRGRPPLDLQDSEAVLAHVASSDNAIGYVQRHQLDDSVRVVFP